MELIARDPRFFLFAEISDLGYDPAYTVVLLHRLSYRRIGYVNAVFFVQRLEYMVFALQDQQLHAVVVGLERNFHILVEELFVPLTHGPEKLHILHAAVYHGASVGRDDAVGKVEAALYGALKQCPCRFAKKARHVVCSNIHRTGIRRMQANAEGIAQIHKRFRCVFADISNTDLTVFLCLTDELIVRLLQEVLKVVQVHQVSHC